MITTKVKNANLYKEKLQDDIPVFEGVRYLTNRERERLQTMPEGYCDDLNWNECADVLGDGWTVDVIAHIFSHIPNGKD